MTGKRPTRLAQPIGQMKVGEVLKCARDRYNATCCLVDYYRRRWGMRFEMTHRSNGTTVRRIS